MAKKNRLVWTDDVMSFLCKRCNEMYPDEPCEHSDCLMIEELDKCKTVDAVEVVHGRWKYGTRSAVCSECGFERHLDDNFGAAIACPNCGAKMDGDGNG